MNVCIHTLWTLENIKLCFCSSLRLTCRSTYSWRVVAGENTALVIWRLAGWSVLWRRLYPQIPSGLPWEWTRAVMVINRLRHDASNTLSSAYDVRLLETPITSCCFEYLCYSELSVKINSYYPLKIQAKFCYLLDMVCW